MMYLLWAALLVLFPVLTFADQSSLNFTPPTTDYSVVFLSNLFGVVDGVLHGSGSQILGTMFGVFNSAVIALGGIIIMYTLIVSTMNTAHEGQFLGQKWSSIWVPVRSVVGIALLMPKASGYSMIQIFVMWVCVQGVGAADKIWNAALDYLNKGGIIIQPQGKVTMPSQNEGGAGTGGVYTGAVVMLEGQVCMMAIENYLKEYRKSQLAKKANNEGVCYQATNQIKYFCTHDVPNLVATVDTTQNTVNLVPMPNFGAGSTKTLENAPCDSDPTANCNPYAKLQGVCGDIHWNRLQMNYKNATALGLSREDVDTLGLTRGIAIQQLYNSMSLVAQAIINNIKFIPTSNSKNELTLTEIAALPIVSKAQFGIPLAKAGTPCDSQNADNCTAWGPAPGSNQGVLFNGTELVGSVLDYTNIMAPTLRIMAQTTRSDSDLSKARTARAFINNAKQEGWLMAGSYFFKLALLNQIAMETDVGMKADDSGLELSTDLSSVYADKMKILKEVLVDLGACDSRSDQYCPAIREIGHILVNNDTAKLSSSKVKEVLKNPTVQTGDLANTIWGFGQNSALLKQPGQPGMGKTKFSMNFNFGIKPELPGFANVSVPCGDSSFWVGCIVQAFLEILLNIIFGVILPNLMAILMIIINQLLVTVLKVPLTLVGNIFISAVSAIQNPLTNPIVALANMGVLYLNAAVEIWITVMSIAVAAAANPLAIGPLIFLMTMIIPLLGTWLGVMAGVGFVTAYYVPFIPFMVFTFGVIGWLIAVIEAMVAAPIVALGVSSPEGDQALGKAEHAIMLLMNVFLRPGMMVIGYISAIALSYVSVWVLNAGFIHAVQFIQGSHASLYNVSGTLTPNAVEGTATGEFDAETLGWRTAPVSFAAMMSGYIPTSPSLSEQLRFGHVGWAGVFGLFFSVLIYTSLYWTVVQESFNLIAVLPDKILRWIGGTQESLGQETLRWSEDTKKRTEGTGEATLTAAAKGGAQAKESLDRQAAKKGGGTSVGGS